MSEHDRGAYTPQPDAPLQFDARGPRGRKPMPMTLIGSGAVLVVVLGALALHYRHDTKADPARPVGEPVAQIKAAAPAAAQPRDPNAAIDVFGGQSQTASSQTASTPAAAPAAAVQTAANIAPAGKTPNFAPLPEAPKTRAQLKVTTEEAAIAPKPLPTTAAPLAPAATLAKAPAAPAYHAPGATPALATAATTVPAKSAKPDATAIVARLASTAPAKPVAVTAATPAKAPAVAAKPVTLASAKPAAASTVAKAAPAKGGVVVQIGAFSSTTQSDKGFSDVSTAMSGEMGGKSKRIETVEVNGKTYFRTSVTGFSSRTAADAFCKSLAAKGHTCFAKG